MRPELDACGIGFVADAHGRASRAVVEAALNGLACVRHRGAVAADAKTADGSGVLLPIPPAIFGAGNGVAMLFVRGINSGISHNPLESSTNDDMQLAVQAFQLLLDNLAADPAH